MDILTQRRSLTALAGALLIGSVAAVAWSLSSLPEPTTATEHSRSRATIGAASDRGPTAADMDPGVFTIALRRPLVDPPPLPKPKVEAPQVVRQPAPPPPATLELTLLGTIITAGQNLAIVADASKSDIKGVGEVLELTPPGVSVERIESDEVTVVFQGTESTLSIDKGRKPPAPRGIGAARSRR